MSIILYKRVIMVRIHISDLQVGDRTQSDIFNNNGIPVLSANHVLVQHDIDKLQLHDIDYIDIISRERMITKPAAVPILADIQKVQPHFTDAVQGVKSLFKLASDGGKLNDSDVNDNFIPLVDNFKGQKDVVALLIDLNTNDDYTYQHSVQVGMISYYIAKWSRKSDKEAYKIGKAGYLHDIGKSRIDPAILKKPSKLTEQEFEEIKKHPIYGYDIIKQSIHDNTLALVALQHHERMNGKGYPNGISGSKIHSISRIITVADIYSAMISKRSYQKERDLLTVLKELHRLSFNEIDPKVTQIFIRHMIPNFIGKKVELNTGEIGTIVLNNPSNSFHPLIRTEDKFIDLLSDTRFEIIRVYT